MNRKNFLFASIFFSITISILLTINMNNRSLNIVNDYATSIIKNDIMSIISSSINDIPDIINIEKNNGEIQYIDFDYKNINTYLSNITKNVIEKLNTKKDNIYYLTPGNSLNNVFLSSIGPKIPIKIEYIGNFYSNINTELEEFGINNAFLKIYIKIEINADILMPYSNKKINVLMNIPISMKVIEGVVPKYYAGNHTSSNMLSIPFE